MIDHDGQSEALQAQLAAIELAMRPTGLLGEIAQSGAANGYELSPHDAADVIMPEKGEAGKILPPMWELVENASAAIKAASKEHQVEVYRLAQQVDMRRSESLSEADIAKIDPDSALWLVEGGGNRTSIVRRELAMEAMRRVYGNELADNVLYQFGSVNDNRRNIPRIKKGKPNPEYAIAKAIAPDYVPDDDSLNEFGLNLATALQAGFTEVGRTDQYISLREDGYPELRLVPIMEGMKSGLDAVAGIEGLNDRQPVMVSNGQYRPKLTLQMSKWAADTGTGLRSPVILGDEPGFTVVHMDREIVTSEREPIIYVNEMVTLFRTADRYRNEAA